jgi:hypothetical protein
LCYSGHAGYAEKPIVQYGNGLGKLIWGKGIRDKALCFIVFCYALLRFSLKMGVKCCGLAIKKGVAKALNGCFWWVLGEMLWFGLNNRTSKKKKGGVMHRIAKR